MAVAPTLGLAATRRGRNPSGTQPTLKHLHTQEEKGKEKQTLIQLSTCRPFLGLGKARGPLQGTRMEKASDGKRPRGPR